MALIDQEDWRPVGVEQLEPNAWRALRSDHNLCVVAGPGAGKSEFLAQKATYLLQTGLCPDPYRILAISFKRDAATNLAERVKKRCPAKQAMRFTSLTFDAFTKSLIDRFYTALPDGLRPSYPYEIIFPNYRDYGGFLERSRNNAPNVQWAGEIAAITESTFESLQVGSKKIPTGGFLPQNGLEFAIDRWWNENLQNRNPSQLSFIMLNRLAELLIRYRPDILAAIRQTYSHVFVDEFQDTTYAQYDFLKTLFHGSRAKITTVGDEKQKIMGWAGAIGNAFPQFEQDYAAERIPLLYNFRSSSDLVQIQHVVARAMEGDIELAVAQTPIELDGDVAQIWNFSNQHAEINQICDWISADMTSRAKRPRDYAVIVRQKANDFENEISETFQTRGLNIRNEARMIGDIALQDMIGEDLTVIFCAMMRVLVTSRHPKSWQIVVDAYITIKGVDLENATALRKCENRLEAFVKSKKMEIQRLNVTEGSALELGLEIIDFFGQREIAQTFSHYSLGGMLDIVIEGIVMFFRECAGNSGSWNECINTFEGLDSIPLMTIHKSKGLEFDTILFVGLDDSSWWSYSAGNPEGMATFFVALSRARQRAIFTYCSMRGRRQKISDLYELLTDAGVPEMKFERSIT